MHFLDFMIHAATFHITDLETLQHFAQTDPDSGSMLSPSDFLDVVGPFLRKLSITLRLPLSFFEAVSNMISRNSRDTQIQGLSIPTDYASDIPECGQSAMWMGVWPSLAGQLKQLQSLHIWLDHDAPSSWSFVDERAVLAAVTEFMSSDKIPTLEDVSVNLPTLNPRHEKPERHFTEKGLQPSVYITLHRRFRQMFHCKETIPGHIEVVSKVDFPIMYELVGSPEWCDGERSLTREEVENFERGMWERGEDVEGFIMSIGPSCHMCLI